MKLIICTLLRALFALQIALTVGATSASAQVFAGIDPVDDNGTLWVAKVAPQAAGLPEYFTFKASFWIENTGAVDVRVTEYEIDYLDSGIPPITVAKNTLIEPGLTKQLKIGHKVMPTQALPLPDLAMITVRFDNRVKIVQFVRMAFYANDTETGRRLFPMDAADLGEGQYWHYDHNHVHNDSSKHQRYGYDLGVKRWNGLSWTNLKPGTSGTANSDYLAYGQPVYAVADGSVVACRRGIPDNVVGISGSGGGNFLWIQHGDELIYYAHFAQNTMDGLCPGTAGQVQDGLALAVTSGQQLGEVGNSGASSHPHLHLSAHYRPDLTVAYDHSSTGQNGVPLAFENIRIASTAQGVLPVPPLDLRLGDAVPPANSLILPNPCGWEIPAANQREVIRTAIPVECWGDVYNLVVNAGYSPVMIDGYSDATGGLYFNGIFKTSRPGVFFWGLDTAQMEAKRAEFADLTIQHIDSYVDQGTTRHAIIFELRPQPEQLAYEGKNNFFHHWDIHQLREDGWVPKILSGTDAGDGEGTVWAALFEKPSVDDWEWVYVPIADYQGEFDDLVAEGLTPTYLDQSTYLGQSYMTGIFKAPIGGSNWTVLGPDAPGINALHTQATGDGLNTQSLTGYVEWGVHRFGAVWQSPQRAASRSRGIDENTTATPALP